MSIDTSRDYAGTSTRSTVALRSREISASLKARAVDLERRWRNITLGVEEAVIPAGAAEATAKFYARGLDSPDAGNGGEVTGGTVAAEILATLVSEAEADTDAFWGTDLGRALAFWGAGPAWIPRSRASHILRLRRQRVHQLITGDALATKVDGPADKLVELVSLDSVRAMLVRA